MLGIVLVAVFVPVGVQAQDDPLFPNHYAFVEAGYLIYFPEGWRAETYDEGVVYLTDGIYTLDFDFFPPEMMTERDMPAGDLMGLAAYQFEPRGAGSEATFDPSAVREIELHGYTVLLFDYLDTSPVGNPFHVTYAALLVEDGTFVVGYVYRDKGQQALPEYMKVFAAELLTTFTPGQGGIVTQPAPEDAPFANTYVFEEAGYAIYFPAGWDAQRQDDERVYIISVGYELDFTFYPPADLVEKGLPTDDLVAAAGQLFAPFDPDVTFDVGAATFTTVNGVEVLVYPYPESHEGEAAYPVTYAVLYTTDGTLVTGYFYPEEGGSEIDPEFESTALEILTTVAPVE